MRKTVRRYAFNIPNPAIPEEHRTLCTLNLPGALDTNEIACVSPLDLLAKVDEVQRMDGPNTVENSRLELEELASVCSVHLLEVS
jgi:hypothetical protein